MVMEQGDLVLTPKYGGRGPCGPMFGISELPREPLEPREPLDPSDPVSGTLEPNPPLPQGAAPATPAPWPVASTHAETARAPTIASRAVRVSRRRTRPPRPWVCY